MEIVGGFMVMLSIVSLFLAVIWFITPFVVFTVKARLDRVLQLLEDMDRRISLIEKRLTEMAELPEAELVPDQNEDDSSQQGR